MKTFRLIAMTMIALLCCMACSDGGKEAGGLDPTPAQPAIKDFTQGNVSLTEGVNEQSFTFTANENWTISVAETKSTSWCTVAPTSGGKGAQTVKITTTANDSYDDRSVTITLKAGSESKSFVVTQKQKNALTVTSDKQEVSCLGGNVAIEVKANVDYKYEIEESAQSWITPASTRGLSTTTIQLSVGENEEDAKREGKIILKSGDLSETVTIYQEGAKPTIVLTKNEYVVASAGEDIQVELRSNVDYKMLMPQECDWITENETRAFSSHTHYFTVSPNEDYDARTAEITFINKENNLSETISITQMQHNAILVAKNEYEFNCAGHALKFEVNTNVDFTVSIDVDWIKEDKTRGLTAYPLHFKVAENTNDKSREGTITIIGSEVKQTIKVKQQMYISLERQALIDLYNATDGDHWTNNENWCSDKPIENWYGITKSGSGNYSLNLAENNLTGFLPESIGYLKNFEMIDLNYNNLTGKIPGSIGNLKKLVTLNLGYNQFMGSIPESIGELVNIQILGLYDNSLTGNLPASLGNLVKYDGYSYINVQYNCLSGEIPHEILNSSWWDDNWKWILKQRGKGFVFPAGHLKAPSFSVTTMDGKQITDEIFTKNKLTIIFQWADWCPYSHEFAPILVNLYNMYKDKGVEVIGNYCFGTEDAKSFIDTYDIKWPNVDGDSQRCILYTNYVPAIHVVNSEKQIVFTDCYENRFNLANFLANELGTPTNLYTSSDYSEDGKVFTLQRATEGKGIDLVFVGEGFVDKDMEQDYSSYYVSKMWAALGQFFYYEPYKSFRNRFNVYVVKAVSPNDVFAEGTKHALDEDCAKAFEYANKVPYLDANAPRNVIVVYKPGVSLGKRSYTNMFYDNSFVAWNMGVINEVINHEAGGHGFAKLGDEYVEPGFENQTFTDFEGLDSWHGIDWYMNVDYHSTKSEVIWKHFLDDSRYKDQVGIYEGSFTYGFGAYRSTENSMMRYNDFPFNAPSREAIYKAIMKASEGDNWKYNYEDFVKYDEINRNVPATRSTSSPADIEQWKQSHRPPVIVKGSWRDAMNNKNQIIVPLR